MQSKVNIFHTLQHASDSEDENDAQNNKAKKIAEKKEQRARPDDKNKSSTKPAGGNPERQTKDEHARTKAPYKAKGVTEEAHPQDRHSGHGNQAFGAKPKKSGAGKGNWGNYKEDRKGNEEQGEAREDATEEQPQEEEKPAGITLSEYYQQQRQTQNEPQVNETKAKITSEQLTKELGTATALKTRVQQQVDDKKVGKKKDRLDVNHHAAINSEHANLLNFRTGFVEKEYKQRGADDVFGGQQGGQQGQRRGPRTGGQRENAKEEEAQPTEGQTADAQPVEGETKQAQEGATEVQTPTQTQGQGQGQGQDDRRRYEGQRGGRGGYRGGRPQGDRPQGDRPQGDRPQGDRPRKQHGGKDQGKINIEDESAFPKLG